MERVIVNLALGTGSPLRPTATGHTSIVTVWWTLTAFSRHQDVLRCGVGSSARKPGFAPCTEPGPQGSVDAPPLHISHGLGGGVALAWLWPHGAPWGVGAGLLGAPGGGSALAVCAVPVAPSQLPVGCEHCRS